MLNFNYIIFLAKSRWKKLTILIDTKKYLYEILVPKIKIREREKKKHKQITYIIWIKKIYSWTDR